MVVCSALDRCGSEASVDRPGVLGEGRGQAGTADIAQPCDGYTLDMTAPRFGDCVCGQPKAAHAALAFQNNGGRPMRRVHALGAQLALDPSKMLQPSGQPKATAHALAPAAGTSRLDCFCLRSFSADLFTGDVRLVCNGGCHASERPRGRARLWLDGLRVE